MNILNTTDTFTEQIIKQKKSMLDYINIILIAVGFLFAVLSVAFLSVKYNILSKIFFFFLAGMIFLFWKIATSFNIEYEYSVTNGDIDIDKIIGKRTRKRIISINAKNIESFKRFTGNENRKSFNNIIFAGSDPKSQDLWYCTFRHNKSGNTLLIFEPNEKVLNAIKPFLPRLVANDAYGRN